MSTLIIGQRYFMPDGLTGKYIGINHGQHADLRCFRLSGSKVTVAKLTARQAAKAQAVMS